MALPSNNSKTYNHINIICLSKEIRNEAGRHVYMHSNIIGCHYICQIYFRRRPYTGLIVLHKINY